MEVYDPDELGNGDPIVVYDPEISETRMLGTGWHSWDELEDVLEYIYENGEATRTIGPDNAEWIENSSGELEIFVVGAHVSIGE